MTTTEKTFQVPLTFKDSSIDLDRKFDSQIDQQIDRQIPSSEVAEANQILAGFAMDLEVQESVSPEALIEIPTMNDDLGVVEDLEMLQTELAPEEAAPKVIGALSLPAALCDEELLQELAGIPNKMGFKIGDVADLLGIKAYVLRYWETEFEVLKPKKAANNQRYYTKKNVENAYLIRKLLHRDRFSIEGARAALKDLKTVVKKEKDWTQVTAKVATLEERLDHLLVDIKQLRNLFV